VADSLIRDYSVDCNKIVVTQASGNLTDAPIGIKPFGSKKILMNGSDFYRKGADIAIAAMNIVHAAIPEAVLTLVASSEKINSSFIECMEYIETQEAMTALFIEADIVIAPARCDPYPGFIIEAMQCGTPCIVSPQDAMPEIVEHEVSGLVLAELNAKELAANIIALLNDIEKMQKFSIAAKQKVAEKFNWQNVASIVYEAIRNKKNDLR